ncbi:sugar ABC transporter permease [Catenuloplanes niger JCM 9533]
MLSRPAAVVRPTAAGRRNPRRRRHALTGMLYAAPTAFMVGAFFVVPLGLVAYMSLHRWPLLGLPTLNAPANYTGLADDRLLRDAAGFTLTYTVIITVLLFASSLGMALLVQRRRRGTGFLRTVFFLPAAVGFASASLLFLGLLSAEIGPFGGVISVSDSGGTALGAAILLVLWRFAGFNMLILLTGLQAVPTEVYEAARLDGANRWQTFTSITLPLMRSTIALVLTLIVTGSLLAFDQFWILTRGGPDNSTTSLVMVVYRKAFIELDLGSAAAVSVALLAVLVVVSLAQLAVLRTRSAP